MFQANSYCAVGKVQSVLSLTEHHETMTFVATEATFSCFYLLYWMEVIIQLHAMANLTLGKKSVSHWVRS